MTEIGRSSHARSAAKQESGWLEALARRYSPALQRYFKRKLGQNDDVADLVQEVFFRLAKLPEPDQIRQPENYLFTTASNALRDHLRRIRIRPTARHERFDPDQHAGLDVSPADILEGRQAVERLQSLLGALPERTRDVFILRVLEDNRTDTVARVLGISTRAVEKHQAKALASLAMALTPYRD